MNEDRPIRIAITQGDTNGVGFELIFKTFEDPTMMELCTPIVYGSPKVASYYRKALETEVTYNVINDASEAKDGQLNLLAVIQEEVKVDMGQPTVDSAEAAVKALAKAVADVRDGLVDALVAGPVNEQGFSFKDLHFQTQTELVAQLLERHARKTVQQAEGNAVQMHVTASIHPLRVLMEGNLRVAVLADGIALKRVADHLSGERLTEVATLLHQSLRRDLDVNNPRIAVLALNPRGGVGDQPAEEERECIMPAIEQLANAGLQVYGPYSAEELLTPGQLYRFDAVLAMHRDQILAPFRLLTQGDGVVLSAGLPIVMTEAGHGACYGKTGKNEADPIALRHAIFAATDVARHRQQWDEPMGNPLPKLYHERRDESEKVRFRSSERRGDASATPQDTTDDGVTGEVES